MAEVRWTPQAANDLDAIAGFIASDSPHYASLFVIDVLALVDRIGDFPAAGRIVPELQQPEIREVLFGSYRIRTKNQVVELLTIYHGARMLDPSRFRMQ